MKSIAIREQQINLVFTPGPWDNFIHGHVTSRTNGKVIAKLVDQEDQPMPWALKQYPNLRTNTQLLISLAPTMLGLLVQLLDLMAQPLHQGVFSISKELKAKLETVALLAAGGIVDTSEQAKLSMFMYDVALDQALIVDHLRGPWHTFGTNQVRYMQLCVADLAPGSETNIPWAAEGNVREIIANRDLITQTLPLAACLTIAAQSINVDRIALLDDDSLRVVYALSQITSRITVPHLTKVSLAA